MSVLDPDRWQALSPHLDRALDMDETERAAWLADLRKEDPALAADLETLLAENRALATEGFLEKSVLSLPEPLSLAGHRIGAYTLVSLIDQGGMGSVWLAQKRPTAATDVYALGTLLFLLLSGRHPLGDAMSTPADRIVAIFGKEASKLSDAAVETGKRTAEAVVEAAARRATTPDGLRKRLRGDLDAILAQALQKKPPDRYPTARAFAAVLERHLQGSLYPTQP